MTDSSNDLIGNIDISTMDLSKEEIDGLISTQRLTRNYESLSPQREDGPWEDTIKCAGLLLEAVELIQQGSLTPEQFAKGLTCLAIRLTENAAEDGFADLTMIEHKVGKTLWNAMLKAYAIEQMAKDTPQDQMERLLEGLNDLSKSFPRSEDSGN